MSRIRVAGLSDLAACYRIADDAGNDPPTNLERDLREPERLLLIRAAHHTRLPRGGLCTSFRGVQFAGGEGILYRARATVANLMP